MPRETSAQAVTDPQPLPDDPDRSLFPLTLYFGTPLMSQYVRSKFSQSKASTGSAFRLSRKQLFAAGVLSVLLSP